MTQDNKPLSKIEIIKKRYPFYNPDISFKDVELDGEHVMELMDEYAKQEAIGFSKFIWKFVERNNASNLREINKGKLWHDGQNNHFSPDEIFDHYLASKENQEP